VLTMWAKFSADVQTSIEMTVGVADPTRAELRDTLPGRGQNKAMTTPQRQHNPNALTPTDPLGKFLSDQAALADATVAHSFPDWGFHRPPATATMPPMPSDFELKHPRRIRCSGLFKQPDGTTAHYSGFRYPTPEQEAWYRQNDPECGLHDDDMKAYRGLSHSATPTPPRTARAE